MSFYYNAINYCYSGRGRGGGEQLLSKIQLGLLCILPTTYWWPPNPVASFGKKKKGGGGGKLIGVFFSPFGEPHPRINPPLNRKVLQCSSMYIQAPKSLGFSPVFQHGWSPSITACRTSMDTSIKANKAQHTVLQLKVTHLTMHHTHRAFVYITSLLGKVTTLKQDILVPQITAKARPVFLQHIYAPSFSNMLAPPLPWNTPVMPGHPLTWSIRWREATVGIISALPQPHNHYLVHFARDLPKAMETPWHRSSSV